VGMEDERECSKQKINGMFLKNAVSIFFFLIERRGVLFLAFDLSRKI
jgi:hypothetical protein